MNNNRCCIKRLYRARHKYDYCDQIGREDAWQVEVYLHALGLMKKNNFTSVIDIGCGSAYKLLTYLGGVRDYWDRSTAHMRMAPK